MPVEILKEEDRETKGQEPGEISFLGEADYTPAPKPVAILQEAQDIRSPVSFVDIGDYGDDDQPGWFARTFDSFEQWNRERTEAFRERKGIEPITREEAKQLTLDNIKRNREMYGNQGYGQFAFGDVKPMPHSALVRAGVEEAPTDEVEVALNDVLGFGDPDRPGKPSVAGRLSDERKNWSRYPKDPNGFIIDPTRPVLQNDDGTESTESTITVEQDGRHFNIPTIIGGKRVSEEAAIANARTQAQKGWVHPNFATEEEALAAAPVRSDAISNARQQWEERDPDEDVEPDPLDEKKEDPWGTVLWTTLTNVPAMFKRQYGGAKMFLNAPRDLAYILESAADQGVAPVDSFALEVEAYVQGIEPAEYYGNLLKQAENNVGLQEGMRINQEANKYLQDYAPNVQEDSIKYYVSAIIEGSINMAPALVATAATRNPSVGAALMGGQVFADQYAESIREGRSHSQAVMDGTVFAAAEVLTERIPLGVLTKGGGTLLKRMLKAGGAEALQEPLTQLLQEAYTKGIITEEMTFGEALIWMTTTEEGLQMLKRSAIIGFGVGGSLATVTHPFYRNVTQEQIDEDDPTTDDDGKPVKKPKPGIPSEKNQKISPEEAEEYGLTEVDVDVDLLERVAAGDPLTLDEQYTLTNNGYGKFFGPDDRIAMLPKGRTELKNLRDRAAGEEIILEGDTVTTRKTGEVIDIIAEPGVTRKTQRFVEKQEGDVTDQRGEKIVVWRGEHGLREDQGEEFQSRVGSLSFGSLETATNYAKEPNDRTRDRMAADPRVRSYTLNIKKPFVNTKDDPFIDMAEVRRKLGMAAVRRILQDTDLSNRIESTNNWEENFAQEFESPAEVLEKAPERVDQLYMDLFSVLDDAKLVQMMRKKGFDGAIHQGMGENFDEIEYRVFDSAQATRLPIVEILMEEDRVSETETFRSDVTESRSSILARLEAAERRVEEPKSPEQAEAGNYKKGHMRIDSLPLTIETAKGQTRSGVDRKGKAWSIKMKDAYGYIKGTESREPDGRGGFDQIDVFVGRYPESGHAVIVNQKKDPKQPMSKESFDEHKIMLGYRDTVEAEEAYRRNYDDGGALMGSVVAMTTEELREWLETANTKTPAVMSEVVFVPGRGDVDFRPFKPALDAAQKYADDNGIDYAPSQERAQVDPRRAAMIAREFEAMEHAPGDPEVQRAYQAMIDETLAQYEYVLESGLTVEFIKGTDPYTSPRDAILDIRENNHLWVFSTREGFGSNAEFEAIDNPLLQETTHKISGKVALANDIFRVVHDYFGHMANGFGFRARGEENAWQHHAAMYSPLARRAMTVETRGQNSWVNFGPNAETNRTASTADTVYADQKIGLLPVWASEEGRLSAKRQIIESRPTEGGELVAPPVSAEGRITLTHYSQRADIDRIDPAFYGQGIRGAESQRAWARPETWVNRTYYGIAPGLPGGYRKESGLGLETYETSVDARLLYDLNSDPENLAEVLDLNESEQAIRDAGYSGYWLKHPTLGLVSAVFDPLEVESKKGPSARARKKTNAGRGRTVEQVQDALSPIYRMFRTVPPVRVVEAIEDLPQHLQVALDDEHSKRNTTGMYDQGAWKDDIYIIANNVIDTNEAIETLLHEVVGHFGLRQVVDPDQFNEVMDEVAESFGKEISEIASLYSLDSTNINERRIAAEEFIAHTAQRVLAGQTVTDKAKALLNQIVKAVRNALRRLTGQKKLFTIGQVMSIISQSSDYVQRPGGYQRDKRRGALRHISTPWFFSQMFTAINDSSAEAQPASDWKELLQSMVKNGQIKADAVEGSGIEEWLDSQTLDSVPKELVLSQIQLEGTKIDGKETDPTNKKLALRFHKRKRRTNDSGLNDALEWADENIGPSGPRSLERLQERINEILRIENKQAKMEQALVDQFAGLKWAIRQTHGHELPAQISGYKQAHFTTSMDSQMYVFLTHGIPEWQEVTTEEATGTITGIKPGSQGLLEMLEPVANNIKEWGYWMAAGRANRLLDEGREALFTQERVDELLKLGEMFPEFQDVADAYNDWKTQFLDWASEAGVINEDTRALWDTADYVPFYRIKSDEMGGSFAKRAGMGGPGIANVTQPIKRLLGSKHPLGDILENIIVNFQHIATTTMKNKAAQLAISNLEGTGLITPAPATAFLKQEFIPMDELKRKLRQAGIDWEAMPDEALEGMQKMWTLQRPQGDQFISVLYNGQKKWFEVHEETLLRSLTAINEKKFSSIIGRMFMYPFRKVKRLGTTMITLAPDFMAANWFRDIFMAFVNSRHTKMPKPWSAATGAWKAFTKSPEMVAMMAAGGAFYSGYINANDPVATTKAMKRALRQTGFKNRILDAPWKLFHLYNDIGAAAENANRIGSAYIPAVKSGAGKAEAIWEAKDLMNFAKHGDHAVVQFFAQSVMFLNARVQGLVRYGQRFSEAPGLTFTKSFMYSLAVLMIWLKNKDDDRYKALPPDDKDMYAHFWINGKHWRLPKSFEVGMIFGVGIERTFEYYYSNEDDAGKVAIDRMWWVIGEIFNIFNRETIVPLPQLIAPLYEATNNWNAFFQSPIVPEYMQDIAEVKPEIVYRPTTSPTAREMARGLPKWAPATLKNPLLLEHLMRGYFASLGAYVMMLSDDMVRKQFDYAPRPDLRWSQIPVAKRFYMGEDPPSRTMYEEVVYQVRENARQIERAVNQLEKLEMDDEIDKFLEEPSLYDPTFTNEEVVEAGKAMQPSYAEMKRIRKEMTALWEDEEMGGEQKLRELNELYRDKLEEAKEGWLERPGASDDQPVGPGAMIQFESLIDSLIDMDPNERPGFLVEQGLDNTADLLSSLPKIPRTRMQRIYWENSA